MARVINPKVLKVVSKITKGLVKGQLSNLATSTRFRDSAATKGAKLKEDNTTDSEKTTVGSTNLKKIAYDFQTHDLTIQFKKGNRVYVYADVPASVYQRLKASPSKGKFFHTNIRFRYITTELKKKTV